MTFSPIDYALHYGGKCRDCADEDGKCPTTGVPCDPAVTRAVAQHVLTAWTYGIQHGFMENPFAALSVPAAAVVGEPVAWRCQMGDQYWHYFTKEPRRKEQGEVWEPLYAAPSAPDGYVQQLEKALKLAADRLDASSHRVGENDSRAAFGIAQWAIEARAALGGASHE